MVEALPGAKSRAHVDGVPIHAATLDETLALIEEAVEARAPASIFTLNLDHLVKLRRDAAFRQAYARATIVTADGWPVAYLARREDPSIQRVAGADLIHPVCALAAARGWPIALYGSTEAVLADSGAQLQLAHPGLVICQRIAPPMGFDVAASAADAGHKAAESGARLCLVALGAPKQEFFADAAAQAGAPVTFLCIGAGLDFIAGKVKRAPLLVQRLGAEWFFRLMQEPRRLLWRYIQCGFVFLGLLLRPNRARPLGNE